MLTVRVWINYAVNYEKRRNGSGTRLKSSSLSPEWQVSISVLGKNSGEGKYRQYWSDIRRVNHASPRYHWSLRYFATQANYVVMERLRRETEAIRAFSKETGFCLAIYDERSKIARGKAHYQEEHLLEEMML